MSTFVCFESLDKKRKKTEYNAGVFKNDIVLGSIQREM